MHCCRSDYNPSLYQNGSREGQALSPSSIEHFSFSDLPNLDYGSPDEDEGEREFLASFPFSSHVAWEQG